MIEQARRRKLEIAVGLCEHPAKTYEEYMMRVGQYFGLEEAIQLEMGDLEEIQKKEQRA